MGLIDFVIVGTPRSGTTLVQRLAGELPGVRTPPETHLLAEIAYGALGRPRFPLAGSRLTGLLEAFAAFHRRSGVEVDAPAVAARLGGEASSVFDLFAAVVADMTGDAEVRGEKTPEHLLWWRPLAVAFPAIKIIAVVRDPRAVVASNLEVPFGMSHVELISERWALDQDELLAARDLLPSDRFLLLRYEDVVADPNGALAALGAILQPTSRPVELQNVADVPRAQGEYWKDNARTPPSTDRVDVWRQALTARQISIVTSLCQRHFAPFGYESFPDDGRPARSHAWLSPAARARRLHYIASRALRMRRVNRFAVPTRPLGARTSD